MSIISIVGIFGNIAGIIIFGKPRSSQKMFYSLMFHLAIFDLVYIIVGVLLFTLPHLSADYANKGPWYYIVPCAIPIGQISMTGSVYFTTGITIERYLTVCHPFFMFSRNLSTKPISIGIILFSIVYNLPKFFEMSTSYELCHYNETYTQNIQTKIFTSEPCEILFQFRNSVANVTYEHDLNFTAVENYHFKNSSTSLHRYGIYPSDLRFNSVYVQVYTIYTNFIVNGVVPFLLVIILNILIVASLQNTSMTLSPDRQQPGNKYNLNGRRKNSR